MADFRGVTVTTVEHRYVLDSPTNMVEVGKAYAVAMQQWEKANPGRDAYDDTIKLRSWDDQIHLYWTEDKK